MSKIEQLDDNLSPQARLALEKYDRMNEKSANILIGTGDRGTAVILPPTLANESETSTQAKESASGELVNIVRTRPDFYEKFLPMGNEDEWKKDPYSQHIINGCHPQSIVDMPVGPDDQIETLQAGQVCKTSTHWSMEGSNGSPETNGFFNRMRVRAAGGILQAWSGFATVDASTAGAFTGRSGSPLPIEVRPPEEVKKSALSYDDSEDLPLKAQHAPHLQTCHPALVPFLKAFMFECWSKKEIQIQINSTYRSPIKQQQVYDKWVANGKQGPKPAAPGTSWHNIGGAFDFNPIVPGRGTLLSSEPKQSWYDVGIVQIGESLGLRWGGNFKRNYDPIHFDLGKQYSNEDKKKTIETAKTANLEPNRVPIG